MTDFGMPIATRPRAVTATWSAAEGGGAIVPALVTGAARND